MQPLRLGLLPQDGRHDRIDHFDCRLHGLLPG
jgi:hypothetical protein